MSHIQLMQSPSPFCGPGQVEQPGSNCFSCYSSNVYCMKMCYPVHSKPFILVLLMKTWIDSLIDASLLWFSNIFLECIFNIIAPHSSVKPSNSTSDITSSPSALQGSTLGMSQPHFSPFVPEGYDAASFLSLTVLGVGWGHFKCPFWLECSGMPWFLVFTFLIS